MSKSFLTVPYIERGVVEGLVVGVGAGEDDTGGVEIDGVDLGGHEVVLGELAGTNVPDLDVLGIGADCDVVAVRVEAQRGVQEAGVLEVQDWRARLRVPQAHRLGVDRGDDSVVHAQLRLQDPVRVAHVALDEAVVGHLSDVVRALPVVYSPQFDAFIVSRGYQLISFLREVDRFDRLSEPYFTAECALKLIPFPSALFLARMIFPSCPPDAT